MLVVNYLPALDLTTALLITSKWNKINDEARACTDIKQDILRFLKVARYASILPMLLPTLLADLIVSFETKAISDMDDTLNRLESMNKPLLDDKAQSAMLNKLNYIARTLNEVRNSLGRSETRLKNLEHLLEKVAQFTAELKITASQNFSNFDAGSRVLGGHSGNLASDAHHLLLQVQNHHTRVKDQQQVVRIVLQYHCAYD